jgi:CBS domain containing-hemolysin-like protein
MANRLQGFLQKGVIRFPRAYVFIKSKPDLPCSRTHRWIWLAFGFLALALSPTDAHASIFKGEALDKVADVLTWVVLVIAPIIGIVVFLLIHILPEKIAEKREHPQAKAIQCLCLLSLVFGGLLWPLAWLWAYSKPVLYKMAYGTDKAKHDEEERTQKMVEAEAEELKQLRQRVAELESKQAGKSASEGGKT